MKSSFLKKLFYLLVLNLSYCASAGRTDTTTQQNNNQQADDQANDEILNEIDMQFAQFGIEQENIDQEPQKQNAKDHNTHLQSTQKTYTPDQADHVFENGYENLNSNILQNSECDIDDDLFETTPNITHTQSAQQNLQSSHPFNNPFLPSSTSGFGTCTQISDNNLFKPYDPSNNPFSSSYNNLNQQTMLESKGSNPFSPFNTQIPLNDSSPFSVQIRKKTNDHPQQSNWLSTQTWNTSNNLFFNSNNASIFSGFSKFNQKAPEIPESEVIECFPSFVSCRNLLFFKRSEFKDRFFQFDKTRMNEMGMLLANTTAPLNLIINVSYPLFLFFEQSSFDWKRKVAELKMPIATADLSLLVDPRFDHKIVQISCQCDANLTQQTEGFIYGGKRIISSGAVQGCIIESNIEQVTSIVKKRRIQVSLKLPEDFYLEKTPFLLKTLFETGMVTELKASHQILQDQRFDLSSVRAFSLNHSDSFNNAYTVPFQEIKSFFMALPQKMPYLRKLDLSQYHVENAVEGLWEGLLSLPSLDEVQSPIFREPDASFHGFWSLFSSNLKHIAVDSVDVKKMQTLSYKFPKVESFSFQPSQEMIAQPALLGSTLMFLGQYKNLSYLQIDFYKDVSHINKNFFNHFTIPVLYNVRELRLNFRAADIGKNLKKNLHAAKTVISSCSPNNLQEIQINLKLPMVEEFVLNTQQNLPNHIKFIYV